MPSDQSRAVANPLQIFSLLPGAYSFAPHWNCAIFLPEKSRMYGKAQVKPAWNIDLELARVRYA